MNDYVHRGGLAVIAFSLIAFLALRVPTPIDAQAQSRVGEPADAARFLDSLGVNVHMAYSWTSYADADLVRRSLDYIGVRHVRDVFIPWDVAAPQFEALARAGVKFDMVIPVIDGVADIEDFRARVQKFDQKFPGAIEAVEGPNEVNIWPVTFGGGNSIANAGDLQRALYASFRRDSALDHVPIYNLTLAYTDPAQHRQLGDLSSSADYANMHAYAWFWGTPGPALDYLLGFSLISAPGLKQVITETGYTTLLPDPYSGVTEDAQAVFVLQSLLGAFKKSVTRTYVYELLDQKADPEGADSQQHFGLHRVDGTPKPAAVAIHNLTSILRSPSGLPEGDTGGPVSVRPASAGGSRPSQLLLVKPDGRRCLLVWVESPLFEKETKSPLHAPVQIVRIEFDRPRKAEVFQVMKSDRPVDRYDGVDHIEIELTNRPVLIQF